MNYTLVVGVKAAVLKKGDVFGTVRGDKKICHDQKGRCYEGPQYGAAERYGTFFVNGMFTNDIVPSLVVSTFHMLLLFQ